MKRIDAILTSDWHLRDDTPTCRVDDFWETQWAKVDFISELQRKYDCKVVHAGDLFHHWKPSPFLLAKTIRHLPQNFYTIYGNHDLPQHNLELSDKTGINVLESAKKLSVLGGTHWNQKPDEPSMLFYTRLKQREVMVWHVMTYSKILPYPGCMARDAKSLLKTYSFFDLIVTGDNHLTFVEVHHKRLLVNPGSLMRQNAGQIDFEPSVFLYSALDNKVEQVFIPISRSAISREHIEVQEKRNDRIDAFVSGLNTELDKDISFQTNLERFFEKNKIRKNIKQLIYKFVS